MFDKKEEIINLGTAETIVGNSVRLKGNLKSEGDITIDGEINGEIKTRGNIKIGQHAKVNANIQGNNVTVSGIVQGNIHAKEQVQITETGTIIGDMTSNVLSILPGASFIGKSTMIEKEKPKPEIIETEELEEKPTKK